MDKLSAKGLLAASWGVFGVLLLLGQAIWRLGDRALAAWSYDLSPLQLALSAAWAAFSLYYEGYRAFQRRFSPRVVARALVVGRELKPLHVALAPAFCMSFFHSTKRGMLVAWSMVVMIVGLVLIVSRLSQPWRGIIDGGVVLALLWGAAAIVVYFVKAVSSGAPPAVDPALPSATPSSSPGPPSQRRSDAAAQPN